MATTTRPAPAKGSAAERRKTGAASTRKPGAAVPHLSVAERVARGKAARNEVPRAGHAVFEPPSTRAHPAEWLESVVKASAADRVLSR